MSDTELKHLIDCKFLGDNNDKEFTEFVARMPQKHWSKYDLGAVRLGWEAHKTIVLDKAGINADRWISVEDKLPVCKDGISSKILVMNKKINEWSHGWWRPEGDEWVTSVEGEITHWKPAPASPLDETTKIDPEKWKKFIDDEGDYSVDCGSRSEALDEMQSDKEA